MQLDPRLAIRPVVDVPVRVPIRIRIGRGNAVYSTLVYGSKANYNPTTVSAGMWNAGTKAWIPADSTWDNGICYGYLDSGTVVAVAQRFNSISGRISNTGALTEGAYIYSQTSTTYTLSGDVLTIYLVDFF
jgi:hypothetical protein